MRQSDRAVVAGIFLSAAVDTNSGAGERSTHPHQSSSIHSSLGILLLIRHPISTMQPPSNGKPSESSSISAAPQINGFAQMSSSPAQPAQGHGQGQVQGQAGQGGGLGTMAEQQKRAHLYVGNLSPRVNEQSEFFWMWWMWMMKRRGVLVRW